MLVVFTGTTFSTSSTCSLPFKIISALFNISLIFTFTQDGQRFWSLKFIVCLQYYYCYLKIIPYGHIGEISPHNSCLYRLFILHIIFAADVPSEFRPTAYFLKFHKSSLWAFVWLSRRQTRFPWRTRAWICPWLSRRLATAGRLGAGAAPRTAPVRSQQQAAPLHLHGQCVVIISQHCAITQKGWEVSLPSSSNCRFDLCGGKVVKIKYNIKNYIKYIFKLDWWKK